MTSIQRREHVNARAKHVEKDKIKRFPLNLAINT